MSETKKIGWQNIRSVTAVDNPLLAAATMDSKPSYAQNLKNRDISALELLVAGAGSVGGTIEANIWLGREGNGPARLAAKATFELGTMEVNKDPQIHEEDPGLDYYAHKVTLTVKAWPWGVNTGNDNGNNRLAAFQIDGWGYDWIAVEITGLTNVTKANVYLSYVN